MSDSILNCFLTIPKQFFSELSFEASCTVIESAGDFVTDGAFTLYFVLY